MLNQTLTNMNFSVINAGQMNTINNNLDEKGIARPKTMAQNRDDKYSVNVDNNLLKKFWKLPIQTNNKINNQLNP